MASQLQRLRRDAGYRSAKDLADRLNIPPSTYSRYERKPQAIPMANAILIAEALDASVDEVVGRGSSRSKTIDERVSALPDVERAMLTEFLDFLETRASRY